MSLFDVLPFIGPSCSRYQLSVLIVSPNNLYCQALSKALYDTHLELFNRWQLSLHTSNDIDTILTHLTKIGPISIDLVIICMDTSKVQCTEWTTEVIRQCSLDLRPGRIILVNGSGLPTLEIAVSFDRITAIKRKFKLQLLNGNLLLKNDTENIAKRINIIMNSVMGLQSGLPCIRNFSDLV